MAILQRHPRLECGAGNPDHILAPLDKRQGRRGDRDRFRKLLLSQAWQNHNPDELLIGILGERCMLGTKTDIPSTSEIIRESLGQIRRDSLEMLESDFVRNRFSDALEKVFSVTYETYKRYEEDAINSFAEEAFLAGWSGSVDREEALKMFRTAVREAIKLEKSLSQSRSSRAGSSFETIVQELLNIIGIPSERVTRGDRRAGLNRIDLVIPDRETAITSPDRAHFLSLKTSLRERWREVVEEQTQGQRTHLLTILQNEVLSNRVAQSIVDHGIFLYVPDRVKDDRFVDEPRIRRLSDLPANIM